MPLKACSTATALAGAILTTLVAVPAEAASPPADRGPAKVAEAQQVSPVALSETDEDTANCSKSRKRLWLEGEGWVVRKVTTCR